MESGAAVGATDAQPPLKKYAQSQLTVPVLTQSRYPTTVVTWETTWRGRMVDVHLNPACCDVQFSRRRVTVRIVSGRAPVWIA